VRINSFDARIDLMLALIQLMRALIDLLRASIGSANGLSAPFAGRGAGVF
jgi:hypothetical protein